MMVLETMIKWFELKLTNLGLIHREWFLMFNKGTQTLTLIEKSRVCPK